MDRLKIGMLGLGRIGKLHADNILQNFTGIHLKAIADPHYDESWAVERPAIHFTRDPDEIITDKTIAAILICSPTPFHASQIIACAKHHKHVFCEKPIALDLASIKQAVAAADEAKIKLQVGFNRRFDPNFAKVRMMVQNDEVGLPHLVRVTSRDPKIPPLDFLKSSGGMLADMSIHDFDMAQYLIGSPINEVYTTGAVLIDPIFATYDDIDTAVINLKFANGALGVIDNSRQAVYGYDQRVEVFGSKGSVHAENNKPTNTVLSNKDGISSDKPLYYFLERYKESYLAELNEFFNAVRYNTATAVTGKDGLFAMIVAKAAEQSLLENRPIKVNYEV